MYREIYELLTVCFATRGNRENEKVILNARN